MKISIVKTILFIHNRFMEPNTRRAERRSWAGVAVCTAVIYLTVPVARAIQKSIRNSLGREFFGYVVIAAVVICLTAVVWQLVRKFKVHRPVQYIWLGAVAAAYIWFTTRLWKNPEEAIHFMEYGALAAFLFNALKYKVKDVTIYLIAACIVLFLGTVDEIIQWMVPDRNWDFRDVWLNFYSGGLALLAIWQGIKPKLITGPVRRTSIKYFAAALTACGLLLGLCWSNSPARVYWYTGFLKPLSFLRKAEPMSEFGYKYKDPEIGIFFSRLTLEEMGRIDREQGPALGRILGQPIAADSSYGRFLETYNPFANPFLYELRIHIFRRDKYYQKTLKPNAHIFGSLVVSRENRIMEKYFGTAYRHSPAYWPPEKNEPFIQKAASWKKPYVSLVSIGVTTGYSLGMVWLVIVLALAAAWGAVPVFGNLYKEE